MESAPSTWTVRPVTVDDLESMVTLIDAMERHYVGDGRISTDQIRARLGSIFDGVAPSTIWIMAIEEETSRALGFAVAFSVFPGNNLEPSWFLKDLFVTEETRGTGVGEALMRGLAREVLAKGGTRLDFTTDTGNDGARRFYDRLGVEQHEKVYFRADGDDLIALAGGRF